jgi:hypothetical protein
MTVIAWDGKTMSADKQGSSSGFKSTVTKLFHGSDGKTVAGTGDLSRIKELNKWREDGAIAKDFPEWQRKDDTWVCLVVASGDGVIMYEQSPIPIEIEDQYFAWGSGREVAIGAMHKGATSKEACEAAIYHQSGCGRGVDTVQF